MDFWKLCSRFDRFFGTKWWILDPRNAHCQTFPGDHCCHSGNSCRTWSDHTAGTLYASIPHLSSHSIRYTKMTGLLYELDNERLSIYKKILDALQDFLFLIIWLNLWRTVIYEKSAVLYMSKIVIRKQFTTIWLPLPWSPALCFICQR